RGLRVFCLSLLIHHNEFFLRSRHTYEEQALSQEDDASCWFPELPNGKTWPKYSEASSISVLLSPNNFTDIHAFRKEECELWRKYA
ncbi:unnamed protein product, partial [Ixodes pacificus]